MGRPKGSLNKKTAEKIAAITATGELPLDYMLRVMRDPTQDHGRRDEMAKAAAGYVHPRLSNVESNHTVKRGPIDYSREELVAILDNAGHGGAGATQEAGREVEPDSVH